MAKTLKEFLILKITATFKENMLKEFLAINSLNQKHTKPDSIFYHPIFNYLNVNYTNLVKVHPNLQSRLDSLNETLVSFENDLDYLNYFLSRLLKPDIPEKTIKYFIPEHILEEYYNTVGAVLVFNLNKINDDYTVDYFKENQQKGIDILNRYLVYLLL